MTRKLFVLFFFCSGLKGLCQHNNEFYSNGATVHVQSGAELHVNGDVHYMGGTLTLDGLLKTQGNSYADASFQQRGTGTYRVQNTTVNEGEEQFISGSFAVRGGQSVIGVDDGSFYNLELDNDQGILFLVGSGNVVDVRNSVNFNLGITQNRIITHDIRTGIPANGADYDATFGIMSTTTGLTSLAGNTISLNGNMTSIDNGYIQGKLRKAISPAGGSYPFVLGLEPAGLLDPRGVQYASILFESNTYDVVTGYFQQGSDNSGDIESECNYDFGYFQGTTHGEWVFQSPGTGNYDLSLWPQGNFPALSIWTITKDGSLSGNACDHSASTVGVTRSGMNGFSSFGVVGGEAALPVSLVSFEGRCEGNQIRFSWTIGSEINNDHFNLLGSLDGIHYTELQTIEGMGTTKSTTYYEAITQSKYQYYRLAQVDFDGRSELFSPIFLPCSNESTSQISIYPNPVKDKLFIQSPHGSWNVILYDLQGKILINQSYTGTEHTINTSKFGHHSFIITLTSAEVIYSHRVIKE